MWSITGTHVLLLSSGLNSGTPLDLVLFIAAFTIPKQIIKQIDITEYYSRLLDVFGEIVLA